MLAGTHLPLVNGTHRRRGEANIEGHGSGFAGDGYLVNYNSWRKTTVLPVRF